VINLYQYAEISHASKQYMKVKEMDQRNQEEIETHNNNVRSPNPPKEGEKKERTRKEQR
jgi:hypothetical protein